MKNKEGLINLVSQNLIEEKKYWIQALSGFKEKVSLGRNNNSKTNFSLNSYKLNLSVELSKSLIHIANSNNHRLFVILNSCVFTLLKKLTGLTDICIGMVIEKQDDYTDFVNIELPVRVNIHENITGKELIIAVMEKYSNALKNQNFPIETLYDELNLISETNYSPLFDMMVFMDGIHDVEYMKSKPGIYIVFKNNGDTIDVEINFDDNQYSMSFIKKLSNYFYKIASALASNLNSDIKSIDIIDNEEKTKLLDNYNNTKREFSVNTNIIKLFFDQAERTPDEIALVYENQKITYKELVSWVDRITTVLENEGLVRNSLIGIIFNESIEMIVSILAVLNTDRKSVV